MILDIKFNKFINISGEHGDYMVEVMGYPIDRATCKIDKKTGKPDLKTGQPDKTRLVLKHVAYLPNLQCCIKFALRYCNPAKVAIDTKTILEAINEQNKTLDKFINDFYTLTNTRHGKLLTPKNKTINVTDKDVKDAKHRK